jgi:carbon storage regulator
LKSQIGFRIRFRGIAGLDRAKLMLVLSRKPGERILIGDKISITVVRIAPGIVRIGVDAPDDLPILREELVTGAELPAAAADVNVSPEAKSST